MRLLQLTRISHPLRSVQEEMRPTPSLIEESTRLIQEIKVLPVRLSSPELEVSNLGVGPHVTEVVSLAVVVGEELHRVGLGEKLRVLRHEPWGTRECQRQEPFRAESRERSRGEGGEEGKKYEEGNLDSLFVSAQSEATVSRYS